MKRNFKYLLILLAGILIFPNISLAQFADQITPIFCNIARAIQAASWGAVAIAWIVVTILFLIALGSPEKFSIAKKGVMVAIIGTVVIMLGASVITIVANTIGVTRGEGNVCDLGGGGDGGGDCDPPCESGESCYHPPGGGPGVCVEN